VKLEQFVCDVCGKQKGAANHWLIALLPDSVRLAMANAITLTDPHAAITSWSPQLAKLPMSRHLCGEGCTFKLLSQWITEQWTRQ
jgi:hypothetical protein